MGIADAFEKHPVVFVAAACLAVSGVVAGVLQWAHSKSSNDLQSQHQQELGAIEIQRATERDEHARERARIKGDLTAAMASLAQIGRHVGGEEARLDVTKLILREVSASHGLHTTHKYFEEDHFYALKLLPDDEYSYLATTGLKTMAEMLGVTSEQLQMVLPDAMIPLLRDCTMHMWRHKAIDIQGDSAPEKIFPFASVTRIPLNVLIKMIRAIGKEYDVGDGGTSDPEPTGDDQDQGPSDDVTSLTRMFRAETAAMVLGSTLVSLIQPDPEGMSTRIRSIEKKGNVFYLAYSMAIQDVVANGEKLKEFILFKEMFVVCTRSDVFMVETTVPTGANAASPHFGWMTRWLDGVRIRLQ